ncbi:MAG: glycerol-3-phosphate 1-O-acyltransferase PlsY [Armatimonadota bacterium]
MFLNIVAVLCAFFIGGIPFGVLIARAGGIKDIRSFGSGNIGATNVLRTLGWKYGLSCFIVDILKGFAPVAIAGSFLGIEGAWLAAVAVATILGHDYSPYLEFQGGKGVASTLGAAFFFDWRVALLAFGTWVVLVALTRYVSLGSIIGGLSATLWYYLLNGYDEQAAILGGLFILGVMIVIRHEGNIRRLLAGEERKLGQKAAEVEEQ